MQKFAGGGGGGGGGEVKRAVFGHFLENFTKNRVFFGARSPSKLVFIGAFRKFLGSVTKNGFLKKYQRGDSLVWQGVESLRRGASPLP